MTQKETVLNHLKTHKGLTHMEAVQEYYILQLPQRIAELRADGHHIERVWIKKKKPDGRTIKYVEYQLKEKPARHTQNDARDI